MPALRGGVPSAARRPEIEVGVQVADRTPAQIQAEIEGARVQLASSLDQLAEKTSPKRLANQAKDVAVEKATSEQGKKVIIGTAAAVVALIVLARVRNARAKK
jgi:hypothetical protein